MATVAQQTTTALRQKRVSQRRLERWLTPWVRDIAREYNRGDITVNSDAAFELKIILRRAYNAVARDVLGFDVQSFKQITGDPDSVQETVRDTIGTALLLEYIRRLEFIVPRITATTNKILRRVTNLSIENRWTATETRRALLNQLSNQRLTIAVTDSQWAVETTRFTAVLEVIDPLKNTVEQIAYMASQGRVNEAVRLSRAVSKLIRLPLSVQEGILLDVIRDNRDRLLTPLTQGGAVSNMRQQASRLNATKKIWVTVGDSKVRPSHADASGQEQGPGSPFVLEGGRLQYPGDGSLGASLTEIINCRCSTGWI